MTEAEDFYSSYIANCVFNAFSCYTAIMLNIITIHAIRKASSLPKPLKTLLLSLAVSDLGIGLLVQPLYIGVLVMMLEPNAENNISFKTLSASIATFFSYPSIFGVTALSIDRFLAIHLHLRYKELVTHKRVVAVVILIWLFSAFLSSLDFWLPYATELIYAVLDSACLVTSAILYCKIYAVVRHHMNEIRAQNVRQDAQNGEMVGTLSTLARLRKSAVGTFYIYLLFIFCYLPNTCIYIAATISGSTVVIKGVSRYTFTLVLVNSSLNPLIYCWKMKDVRHVVMDMLRNRFRRK